MKDIKTAYRKKAIQLHPDKGGKEEDFKKLVEAYEILSDEKKRKLYDNYGKAGVNAQGSGPTANDFASAFQNSPFGSSFQFGGNPSTNFQNFFQSAFTLPTIYQLELSLEDYYHGKNISILLSNQEKFVLEIIPGMFEGLEIHHTYYTGDSSNNNNNKRDIIFILQELPHRIFQRKNADLFMECKISFYEMFLGFEKNFKHLDGTSFILKSKEGEMILPNEIMMIEGLGMPIYSPNQKKSKLPAKRGRLFVKIKIDSSSSTASSSSSSSSVSPSRITFTAEEREKLLKIFQAKGYQPPPVSPNKKSTTTASYTPVRSDLRRFGQVGGSGSSSSSSPFSAFSFGNRRRGGSGRGVDENDDEEDGQEDEDLFAGRPRRQRSGAGRAGGGTQGFDDFRSFFFR
jgi:DnaJ family protein B protein 4